MSPRDFIFLRPSDEAFWLGRHGLISGLLRKFQVTTIVTSRYRAHNWQHSGKYVQTPAPPPSL
ncbi:hypothetical protein AM571_PA00131 (plasmid) [Rhizobium etli 8C-3]|uniref:Uncharacterized protein n=1 Tax=Rhizobium etli 8C-3 TaxID=538025 RepID=A0A1L5PA33_RHIET|nr:hypothetical protein AM571_PA00131 [Rhizobium etli 8C-3]